MVPPGVPSGIHIGFFPMIHPGVSLELELVDFFGISPAAVVPTSISPGIHLDFLKLIFLQGFLLAFLKKIL